MIRSISTRFALAAALTLSIPATTVAQAEDHPLEGVDWHLIGYAVDGEIGIVPWHVDATLLLADGTASGSSGCNQYSGAYTLEGERLTFDPALTMTRMACPGQQSAVEDGFVANLPQTTSWAIEDGVLSLTDDLGGPLLDFEEPVTGLTPSDMYALARLFEDQQAQIDQLDERLDNVRIGTLRDRIKTLEAQVKALRSAAASSSSSSSSGSGLNTAEQMLLKGVPANIRSTCQALRGRNLPRGTVSAVQCSPNSSLIGEMAYYLMDYPDGRRTFNTVMRANSVPERFGCPEGRASQMLLHPYSGEGCFVADGAANVRLMYMASGCQQMDVGGKHLDEPVIYVAIEGTGNRIRPLWNWTRDSSGGSAVTRDIAAPGQSPSPACAGGI